MSLESLGFTRDSLIKQASDLYLSGLSIKKVAFSLNLSRSYIRRGLIKIKTPIRPISESVRKYNCNNQFFKIIDSEEKAYWLGFLAADGCISKRHNHVTLNLSSKDRDQVEKFKRDLNATYPVHNYTTNRKYLVSRIRITSKELVNDLIDKGVTPRKSLTLESPKNVPDCLIRHWIRGYFDGDGCVSIHIDRRNNRNSLHLRVYITGTKEVLEFILKQVGLDQTIRQRANSKAFNFSMGGPKKGLQFYHYMYDGATAYLERKKGKFEEYINRL